MLNPFPIQFLALLAYLLLRIFVGIFLAVLASRQIAHTPTTLTPQKRHLWYLLAAIELILATLFVLGAYTQYAALALLALVLGMLRVQSKTDTSLHLPNSTAFLLIGITLSLFITGAGAFAVDLPI